MESDVVSKLKGAENWCVWRFQLRVMLCAQDVFDVMNGTLLKPTSPETLGASPTAFSLRIYKSNVG